MAPRNVHPSPPNPVQPANCFQPTYEIWRCASNLECRSGSNVAGARCSAQCTYRVDTKGVRTIIHRRPIKVLPSQIVAVRWAVRWAEQCRMLHQSRSTSVPRSAVDHSGVRSGSSYPLRLRRQSRCAAVASRWGASSSFSLSHCVLTAYETLRNRALGMSKTQTSRRKEARDGSRDDSDWDRGRLVVIAPPRFSEAPWAAMSLAGALAGQNPFQSPGEPRLLSVRHAVDFGRWCRHTGRQRRYEGSVRAHRWRS
jgi:hypothetical protein